MWEPGRRVRRASLRAAAGPSGSPELENREVMESEQDGPNKEGMLSLGGGSVPLYAQAVWCLALCAHPCPLPVVAFYSSSK